jgi:hypothetical protein
MKIIGIAILCACLVGFVKADEKLVFKTDWKGERIELPPPFAPRMTWKGIEEIRFAPGMFDAKSESFFTYVFVFAVSEDQKLTKESIEKETLAYYQGLAGEILKGKGKDGDTSKFTFKIEESKEAKSSPAGAKEVTEYTGKLDWIEPFVTAEAQVLHFEIHAWNDPATKKNYLFVCTSPKERTEKDATWENLRKIRSEFAVKE